MVELEQAKQRTEKKQQIFDSAKPNFVLLEAEALKNISPRISTVIEEVRDSLQSKGEAVIEVNYFLFRFSDENLSPRRLTHTVIKDKTNQPIEKWVIEDKIERETISSTDILGHRWLNTRFEWVKSENGLNLLIDECGKDSNWVKQKAIVDKIGFWFKTEKGELIVPKSKIDFVFFLDIGKNIISLEGGKYTFDMNGEDQINLFVESIFFHLKKNDFNEEVVWNNNTDQKNINAMDPLITLGVIGEHGDNVNHISQTNEDQLRMHRAQLEERERVISEIESRMRENPNYKVPGWISQNVFLDRGNLEDKQSERFLSEDNFQNALKRSFPSPQENG